jgi:outer membrane protein OmpA-like peptidoglycan-associated protein
MSALMKQVDLAQFVDRDTIEFVREYPHPMSRVWASLTQPDLIRVWWVPFTTLETRPGGRYAIETPSGNAFTGTLTEFDPPKVINFSGLTRFELFELAGGCRMIVRLKRWPNGWSPMQIAGFHAQFDQLELHLDGADKDTIEKTVDTWRHVFPAYELLVRRNVNAGKRVYYRIHFGPNSASISDEGKQVLDEVNRVLKEKQGMSVELDGHCDDPCSMEESIRLAGKRISVVAGYLEAAGVTADRVMKIVGRNDLHRVVLGDSEAGRAFNRRVDLRPIY